MTQACTIWLTGLSGAGKSTLAAKLEEYLKSQNLQVQLLDGDTVRNEIGHLFGYSKEERLKMSKVIRFTSRLLNSKGIHVIVAAIAPYQEMRDANRREIDNYFEVFVNCSLDECIRRDVKGMYKKALNGQISNVVGIDDVYEVPKDSDVEVQTDRELEKESMNKIISSLMTRLM
jgi:adenylylsulfate kinase